MDKFLVNSKDEYLKLFNNFEIEDARLMIKAGYPVQFPCVVVMTNHKTSGTSNLDVHIQVVEFVYASDFLK